MLSNLLSLISKSASAPSTTSVVQVTPKKSNNPFSSENNVFLTNTSFGSKASYGKNEPISGGYFAGYYNNKPNIVGRKLFIEV